MIPQPLLDNYKELIAICTEHPHNIPVQVLARFLHIKDEGLRNSIEIGQCPFGYSWKIGGNRVFKIPTLKFYRWYLNCTGIDEWGEPS